MPIKLKTREMPRTTKAAALAAGVLMTVAGCAKQDNSEQPLIACNTIAQEADPSPSQWPASPVLPSKEVGAYLAGTERGKRIEAAVQRFGERVLRAACDPSKNPWAPFEDAWCASKDDSVNNLSLNTVRTGYVPQQGDWCDFRTDPTQTQNANVEVYADVGPHNFFTTAFSRVIVGPAKGAPATCTDMINLQIDRVKGTNQWSVSEILFRQNPADFGYGVDTDDAGTPADAQAIDKRALDCLNALSAS